MTSTDDSEDTALEQRLAFHRHMRKHLQELSLFVLYEAVESDLTDVEWARHLKQQMAEMKDLPRRRVKMPFEQTKAPVFHAFVERLYAANPAPVLIWTEFATTCGPMRIGSITDVNFDFGFDANAVGIVTFTTVEGTDRLLLSWEENDAGQRILEIEITGQRWCQALNPSQPGQPR